MATTPETAVGARAKYEPVIGLEVHVQLLTRSKIFCSCSAAFGAPPNSNVCPVCLGLPGSLPVLNREAVEFAVRAAMALNCEIRETSIFARKNYFYPDLPKGYQISQYDKPLAEHGWIDIRTNGASKRIGITRLHLEEDAGKSLHEGFADSADKTYLDLNRCGVPLAEIVSEPEIASPDEAHEYLTRLKEIILFTGVSDCNMEEGSLRCDANVSVRPRGQKEFGTKTEVKNVNSFRFIRQALEYEIERQIGVLESGGKIVQETRLYNPAEGKTYGMRSKEHAHDYRYFPEPDLLPLVVDAAWQAKIRQELPELPEAMRKRFVEQYGITEYDAHVLTATRALAEQFEMAAKAAENPKRVANLVQGELMGRLKAKGLELEQSPISMKGVAMSADLVESGTITGKMLKDLYDLCFERNQDFPEVYKTAPKKVESVDLLTATTTSTISGNMPLFIDYRSGKDAVENVLFGIAMKKLQGRADIPKLREVLKWRLKEKQIAEIIASAPDEFFPGQQLKLIARDQQINSIDVDLLFERTDGTRVAIELKVPPDVNIGAEQLEQLTKLKSVPGGATEVWLVGHQIPYFVRQRIEAKGIKCVQIESQKIREVATKLNIPLRPDAISDTTP